MQPEELRGAIKRAAKGDRAAAAAVFDAYYPRIYRYALGRLRSPADAEDVAAETFARVIAQLDRFRWKGGGFEAWLFKIARNLTIDRIRLVTREHTTDKVVDGVERDLDHLPEVRAVHLETSAELAAIISGLPEDQQEVLLLRFAADLDTKETASVMGRKANAIRQLQFRALSNVRNMLDEGVVAS